MTKKNKKKIIEPPREVIEQINEDLEDNSVKIYEIGRAEVPKTFIQSNLIHPDVFKKSKSVAVGLSACAGDRRKYMYLAPERIDQEKGAKVTDLDPIVMAYDLKSGSPAPSGVTCFHADFDGRTEEIKSNGLDASIGDLEKDITGKGTDIPFEKAPIRLIETMHYSARAYRETFDDENIGKGGEK